MTVNWSASMPAVSDASRSSDMHLGLYSLYSSEGKAVYMTVHGAWGSAGVFCGVGVEVFH